MQTSAGNRFFFGRVRGGVMGIVAMKLCNIEVISLVIFFIVIVGREKCVCLLFSILQFDLLPRL